MEDKLLTIPPEMAGKRIDQAVSELLGSPRSAVQKWIGQGRVTDPAGRFPYGKNTRLKGEETVLVQIPDPVVYEAKAEDIPLEIVYEDSDLLVVNKPKGHWS